MVAELSGNPHLWILALDRPLISSWIAEHEPLLSHDERRRYNRYQRISDRHLFLAAHVFVRQTLSRYADLSPAEWVFNTTANGRPEIANVGSQSELRFNLAHTAGMVAVLVHDKANGGVDVEHLGNVADPVAMSSTVFADAERSDFLELDGDRREVGFYKLWTLKEALIKAKGKGLTMPLKEFAFSGVDGPDIRLTCGDEIDPDPAAWHFTVHQPSPGFVVATAYHSGVARPRRSPSIFHGTLSG